MKYSLELALLPHSLAVCRLEPQAQAPDWALGAGFCSLTRTPDELSLVVPEPSVPPGVRAEKGWRALGVKGSLDFSLTGVLLSLAAPLADAGIGIFALSTYDTDYVLVKEADLQRALAALRGAGHRLRA